MPWPVLATLVRSCTASPNSLMNSAVYRSICYGWNSSLTGRKGKMLFCARRQLRAIGDLLCCDSVAGAVMSHVDAPVLTILSAQGHYRVHHAVGWFGWRRGSVVRTSVFGWRTFPDLRLIYGWHVTTSWVRCPLWVNKPGQLSLLSLRGR